MRLEWNFFAPKINTAESDVDDEFVIVVAIIIQGTEAKDNQLKRKCKIISVKCMPAYGLEQKVF